MTRQGPFDRKPVVVSALGITQTLAWASTYYLTAVFTDPVSADLHLSRIWFYGSVSAALLLSGLLGPAAGRMIDRHGGRDILAATNLVFAAGLALLSLASGPATLVLAWLVIGAGMGFGLYEAAFATAAGLYGRDARNAITGITLFAGFASTVSWPASALFIDAFGWRGACLAWAGLHLALGLPLNRLLVPKTRPPAAPVWTQAPAPGVPWTMIVLAGVFGATWFVSTALAAHLPGCSKPWGRRPRPPLPQPPSWGRPRSRRASRNSACCAARPRSSRRVWRPGCIRSARHCWPSSVRRQPYRSCCCMAAAMAC